MGKDSLVCIINLLIAPVSNVLMRLGCQNKGAEDSNWQSDFFKPGNYHHDRFVLIMGKITVLQENND